MTEEHSHHLREGAVGSAAGDWLCAKAAQAADLVAAAVFPRGLTRGSVSFTCSKCQWKEVYERVEPTPPRWMPMTRYLGIGWNVAHQTPASKTLTGCQHLWSVSLTAQLHHGGSVSCSGTQDRPDEPMYVKSQNGPAIEALPANAAQLIKAIMDPKNRGIAVGRNQNL